MLEIPAYCCGWQKLSGNAPLGQVLASIHVFKFPQTGLFGEGILQKTLHFIPLFIYAYYSTY